MYWRLRQTRRKKIKNDVFIEKGVGLDHLSLFVATREDLVSAVQVLDRAKVSHGEVRDLGPDLVGIYVLAFLDLDNIQIELTAPYA